jgi:tellurite resistance protein
MGLTGMTIALQKMESVFHLPFKASLVFLIADVLLFGLILALFTVRIFKYREEVKKDWRHPVKINFFPAFSIGLLLISIAFLEVNSGISKIFWLAGTGLHLIFTLLILSFWIQHDNIEVKQMNPSWFIPVVGNMMVPVAGVHHGIPGLNWFFFSIGFFFWIILMTIFFYRVVFHHPLPEKLKPTLFILIAPPAVGMIAIFKMTGSAGIFAQVLYYLALFFVMLLFFQFRLFRKIKFFLSWWAYSFPMAAITIASVVMLHETHAVLYRYLALGLFILLFALIVLLTIKTIGAVRRKEICVEE